jgi:hypothetical protein
VWDRAIAAAFADLASLRGSVQQLAESTREAFNEEKHGDVSGLPNDPRRPHGVCAVGRAQEKSQEDLRKPLIGTWRLTSINGGAGLASNRGNKPTGIIMYDPHGLMNVQIPPDRPRPKWTGAPTPEQALEAIRGYTAYWGTYTIDEKAQTVTHHPQGMLFGDGSDYVRKFELMLQESNVATRAGQWALLRRR